MILCHVLQKRIWVKHPSLWLIGNFQRLLKVPQRFFIYMYINITLSCDKVLFWQTFYFENVLSQQQTFRYGSYRTMVLWVSTCVSPNLTSEQKDSSAFIFGFNNRLMSEQGPFETSFLNTPKKSNSFKRKQCQIIDLNILCFTKSLIS